MQLAKRNIKSEIIVQTIVLAKLLSKLQECFQQKNWILEGKSVISMNLLKPTDVRCTCIRTFGVSENKPQQVLLAMEILVKLK